MTNRQTDRHTDPSTVTLAVHAHQGLIMCCKYHHCLLQFASLGSVILKKSARGSFLSLSVMGVMKCVYTYVEVYSNVLLLVH